MKLCIFSDIHANRYAFETALPLLLREKADAYIFLGDLCGYYHHPLEVRKMLCELPSLVCVRGNHDAMLLEFLRKGAVPESYRQKYGPGLDLFFEDQASEARSFIQWLGNVPETHVDAALDIRCTHAYPDGKREYLYPSDPPPEGRFEKYVFFGHTHYTMAVDTGKAIFVNPGSIGQPRDGKPPSFATIVLPEGQVRFHNFVYDHKALLDDLRAMTNVPPYLSDIIRRSL